MFLWLVMMIRHPGKTIKLFPHQEEALSQLKTGSILYGGVGSGKSRTAIAYYYKEEFPKNLYIITTAAKRDTLDWEQECALFGLTDIPEWGIEIHVDSWNNIKKYVGVSNSFFIFDEQRVVGSGVWVKSFIKITKNNNWILLSATPGDTWLDYIPVFIANGFYKNRTEFVRRHVVYNSFTKFPKVDRYVETARLERLKREVLIGMDYKRKTSSKYVNVTTAYDKEKLDLVYKKRWNPFESKPIRDVSSLFFTMRKVVNSDIDRLIQTRGILEKHKRVIVFYNFNYELEILRELSKHYTVAEYNGHKHESIPDSESWAYLVQYISGSEGWNCVETNTVVFYSLNYSYRLMTQAAGRIDRLNTPFANLYYYRLISDSLIDQAILKALKNKKRFNEKEFAQKTWAIIEGE